MADDGEAIARQLVGTERDTDPIENGLGIGTQGRRVEIEIDLAEVERYGRFRRG